MYTSLLPASLLLSLVAAQSTTSTVLSATSAAAGTASVCAAQPVLEACLASTEAIANACSTTDYQCLCEKWNDVLTCFNDCPNDARYSSVSSNHATYCNDASVYLSTATTPISAQASSSAFSAATTTAGSGSQTTGSSGAIQVASSTSSASSTATGKSGAGSNMAIGAGQVVLGLAGVVGALL